LFFARAVRALRSLLRERRESVERRRRRRRKRERETERERERERE
jgi:hypothetical protein